MEPEVTEIPVGLVQPWMLWHCLAELFLGSWLLPAVIFLFWRNLWVLLLIPVFLIASYLITARDKFALAVWYESAGSTVRSRALNYWNGTKTYVP
ncbi:VirB3 family type IV secretion system protein [Burkholderia multivorans]|uniref:VirB3 family type IV secretion system protein n=1 Tax=Burkholderia multivorans TaxID=87883 RepID=A0AAP2MS64_9BURK|nr:VirB3 family type IV secretion system protein [Burkholderia multivorans]KVS16169.1 mating pair formation protein [Burkholderia multivorans]MBU9360524.1 VirB3 family type IV secretion system protein [Burkholderia multivorans]MBU9651056.1 VirB3 family type IV secretion system protein [Burkholderia multivorans]MCA8464001.1 VirB3 family type IV secretion system protein [Burkholderia multivorans]MCO1451062.1 VirB3 family type IV secretion system protein [Burkholderia multivorans]